MPYEYGERWNPDYSVHTTCCDETWQSAANVYRQWHSQQFWSKTKFKNRKDIPRFFHAPPLCINSQLPLEDIETLEKNLMSYRQKYKVPIIYLPVGWEKHGAWIGPDDFPVSIG